jgi:predicted DNA-binding ribbon-helix-helix protein
MLENKRMKSVILEDKFHELLVQLAKENGCTIKQMLQRLIKESAK